MSWQLYDRIGHSYARTRSADPRIAEMIRRGLGDARTVINVGSGTGSYEPSDRRIVAVEPAWQMIRQRSGAAPVVCAVAEALPFATNAFDAALAVLTMHHWVDWRRGLAEMRRVAKRSVILTMDPDEMAGFWLSARYFPEIAALDQARFPRVVDVVDALGGCRVQPLPIPHDCVDGFLAAYWQRPEAYFDPSVRAGISALAILEPDVVRRGLINLRDDLESGEWEKRWGYLRQAAVLDVGYRLLIRH
jgi:SAM-dependent methyltransferase